MQKFRFLIVIFLVMASVTWGAELRKLGSNDLEWATPNQGAATTTTSPQGKVVTKIDAKAVPFRGANAYVDDLVNGLYNLTIKPLSITGSGAGTISGYTLNLPAGSLSGTVLMANSVHPSALMAPSRPGTGTYCYRDDGSWGSCGGVGDNITLPITGAMIDNSTLNLNHFPADIRPIRGVNTLPECLSVDYPEGAVVYLATDWKLYVCLDNGSWQPFVTPPDISGVIDDNALRENIISTAQFAQGIRPVQLVDADPILPDTNYPAGAFIFNISTNLLKKTSNGLTWDNAVTSFNASNIAGQLTAEQIASIAATQVTGQLTSDQIASLDGSKIVGEIWATEIADNSVSTPKLVAGAVTTEKVAAGTITADLLAANSVVAGKVSANAIEAGNIAANAVTAGTIAANAVTAGTISAGAIGATEIATGAIIAGKIGADAVVAANVAAGSIQAGDIAAGAINSSTMFADLVVGNNAIIGGIAASKISTDSLSAISANMGAITSGSLTLDLSGYIRTGGVWYGTGTGIFIGYDSGYYRLSIGNQERYLRWNGYDLEVGGDIIATGNIQSGAVSGGKLPSVTAGTAISLYNSTRRSSTNSSAYVKAKETTIQRNGTWRISWSIENQGYSNVYRYRPSTGQTTAVGTPWYKTGSNLLTTSQDIPDWLAGDRVEIWIRPDPGWTLYVQDFYCRADDPTNGTVSLLY